MVWGKKEKGANVKIVAEYFFKSHIPVSFVSSVVVL